LDRAYALVTRLFERNFRRPKNQLIELSRKLPLEANNNDPKGFVWTATAEQILEKVRRGRAIFDQITA
jgi:hypothetical protein